MGLVLYGTYKAWHMIYMVRKQKKSKCFSSVKKSTPRAPHRQPEGKKRIGLEEDPDCLMCGRKEVSLSPSELTAASDSYVVVLSSIPRG